MTGDIYLMMTEESRGAYHFFTWGYNALQNDEYFGGCNLNDVLEEKQSLNVSGKNYLTYTNLAYSDFTHTKLYYFPKADFYLHQCSYTSVNKKIFFSVYLQQHLFAPTFEVQSYGEPLLDLLNGMNMAPGRMLKRSRAVP